MTTQFRWYLSHIPGTIGLGPSRVSSVHYVWVPRYSNVHNPGWAILIYCKSDRNHHGSSGGILGILPVSSLMGYLYSLIDRKRTPMPYVVNGVCHRPGSWGSTDNIRSINSTSFRFCSSLIYCFRAFPVPSLEIPCLITEWTRNFYVIKKINK